MAFQVMAAGAFWLAAYTVRRRSIKPSLPLLLSPLFSLGMTSCYHFPSGTLWRGAVGVAGGCALHPGRYSSAHAFSTACRHSALAVIAACAAADGMAWLLPHEPLWTRRAVAYRRKTRTRRRGWRRGDRRVRFKRQHGVPFSNAGNMVLFDVAWKSEFCLPTFREHANTARTFTTTAPTRAFHIPTLC